MLIKSKFNDKMVQYDGKGFQSGLSFEGGNYKIAHTENVTPVLKRNYQMKQGLITRPKSDFGHMVASIPETVYAGLLATRPEIAHNTDALVEFLNTEEGKQWKVFNGGI